MTKDKINQLATYLQSKGIYVNDDESFPGFDLCADLYVKREGKSMMVLKYRDYFFVHDVASVGSVEKLTELHEKARKVVNKEYKVPKALRMTVPNIATIVVSETGFSPEMIDTVQKNTRSIVGGEYHAMYLIDLKEKQMYSQGIHLQYVPGEARLIWGSRKEFKKIDPQNRMHYLIKEIAELLMK